MIADELAQDEAVRLADTVLLTVPNQLGVEYNARLLQTIAEHVAPAIGWQPAAAPAAAPCSSTSLTDASSALTRNSAAASAEPKRPPGAEAGPWWQSTQCSSASRRDSSRPLGTLGDHPLADHDVAEQPPLLAETDLRPQRELARAAEVVDDRGGQQQVGVQPGVKLAELVGERRHRHGVLEQPAQVGVVAAARAR